MIHHSTLQMSVGSSSVSPSYLSNFRPNDYCSSGRSLVTDSNGGQLGSLLLPRFRTGVDRTLVSRKSFLGVYHRRSEVCRSRGNLSGGFREEKFYGQRGDAEREKVKLSKFGPRARRVVAAQASAAAGASAAPPGPQNFFATLWANFIAICVSFSSRLQSIRIGWLDLLTMLRIVLLAVGAFGAYIASKRIWLKIQETAAGKSEGGEEGNGSPMQVLARGATCLQSNMGPWSIADMTIGLSAMAKLTVKKPPSLPGQEVKDLTQDPNFLLRAQHWRALSEAVYVKDSASFSVFSSLPESSLVASAWEPCQETFRPAYVVFVDAPYGAVVLSVRGTSHIIDMLLNSGAAPEPFGDDGNYAHGGFVHAAKMLHEEALPHIEKAFKDHHGSQKDLKLVIVGHSMGAAVGSLVALKLQEKWPNLQCWGFCPPACMSLELAKECKSFTTSFISAHDVVPRFSFSSVEKLRTRIQEFDWDEVEEVAKDDEDWQGMKKGLDTFKGLQQAHKEAMEKLTGGSGEGNSQTSQKAKGMAQKALETELGGKVRELATSVGLQAQNVIDGGNGSQKDEADVAAKDGGEGEGEDGGGCNPQPLHPPGRLLVMGSDPPGCGKMPEQRGNVAPLRNYGTYPNFDEAKNVTWRMCEAQPEDMEEIIVSPWLVSDHMLGNICEAISYFQSRCPPAVQ